MIPDSCEECWWWTAVSATSHIGKTAGEGEMGAVGWEGAGGEGRCCWLHNIPSTINMLGYIWGRSAQTIVNTAVKRKHWRRDEKL